MRRVFVLSDPHLNLDLIEEVKPRFVGRKMTETSVMNEFKKKTYDMSQYGLEWKNHISRLEENWNNSVSSNDIVIIPGDISANKKYPKLDLTWINERPGTKILGCGNHDKWWPSKETAKRKYEEEFKTIKFVDQHKSYIDDKIVVMGTRMCDNEYNCWPIINKQLKEETLKVSIDKTCCQVMKERLNFILNNMNEIEEDKIKILMIHHPPYNEKADINPIFEMILQSKVDICLFGHIHTFGRFYLNENYHTIEDIQKVYPSINLLLNQKRFICASSDLLKHSPLQILQY
ncbi:hypothetical protein ENUP19_0216G0033 [Entamoeba nuttalli]|uniref:Ser/thr protein phosphatase family protein n=2 Tax=Entamoeba nuttalli TaxID=412467 RepID=K2HB40_ENTNP|nr:ser/thr protein phosphatase family protein [Entamoeba nuttalli P19]EKE39894.1 ser/thr protein phosphatase family protein [Entamoeba nuttalli P19]|eukprot:XP_008857776.1 ser/thr protein phosphatase family protein [Entamoeba nuttalli P19]